MRSTNNTNRYKVSWPIKGGFFLNEVSRNCSHPVEVVKVFNLVTLRILHEVQYIITGCGGRADGRSTL